MFGNESNLRASDPGLGGIHIAKVIDNNDPKAKERVLIRVYGIHDMDNDVLDNAIWAEHCAFSKFSSGDIPDVGDHVYVMFGSIKNPHAAIWLGWVRTMKGK